MMVPPASQRKLIQVAGVASFAHAILSSSVLTFFLLNPSIILTASAEQTLIALSSSSGQTTWMLAFFGFIIECLLNIAFILGVFVILLRSNYVLTLLGTAFAFLSIAVFEGANATLALSGVVLGNSYASAGPAERTMLVGEMKLLLAIGLSMQEVGILLSAATGLMIGAAIVRSRDLNHYLGWYLLTISTVWLVGLLPWAFALQVIGFYAWFVWVFAMGVALLRYSRRLA